MTLEKFRENFGTKAVREIQKYGVYYDDFNFKNKYLFDVNVYQIISENEIIVYKVERRYIVSKKVGEYINSIENNKNKDNLIDEKERHYIGILTTTRRDINNSIPKRLLINIIDLETNELFRDHNWINEEKRIKRHLSEEDNYKLLIIFTAKIKNYLSSTGIKQGLSHIRNIRTLKRIRKLK